MVAILEAFIYSFTLRPALSCHMHTDQCIVCFNGLVGIHILPTVLGSLVQFPDSIFPFDKSSLGTRCWCMMFYFLKNYTPKFELYNLETRLRWLEFVWSGVPEAYQGFKAAG